MSVSSCPDKNVPLSPGRRKGAPRTGKQPRIKPDLFNPRYAEDQSEYLLVYGPDAVLFYVNTALAWALGYPRDTMIGSNLLDYVAGEDRQTVTTNITLRQKKGDIPLYEIAVLARDGLRRSVIVRGRPVIYGDKPATLLTLIDITRDRTLEEQLMIRAEELEKVSAAFQLANRKLTLLTTITRHDINNQLSVLKGYLELLEARQQDPVLAGYCVKAETAADRIAAMIRFTGQYGEVGITAPSWQDCRTIVDEAAREASLGQISLKNDLPEGLEIFADPLVFRVFYNLMDNAVRYGDAISGIRFSVRDQGGALVVICQDDGKGIPREDKERIFERGFGSNTGLGLALSREILDITGITISETGTPGKGARFEIRIPCGRYRNVMPY